MAENDPSPTQQYIKNLALAAAAGQAGCAAVIIIMVALFVGLWLDTRLGWRGPFTIGLLVCSAPLSLLVMVKIALGAVGKIVPQPRSQHPVHPPEKEELPDG
jgi:MFS family permease